MRWDKVQGKVVREWVEMHWKTYRNELRLTDSVWILRVTSTPALFTETYHNTRAVPSAEGTPQGMGQSSGAEQDHFGSSVSQKGLVWGRNLCKTSRTTFFKISANASLHGALSCPGGREDYLPWAAPYVPVSGRWPFTAVPADNGSYTPCREQCCIQALPAFAIRSLGTCDTQCAFQRSACPLDFKPANSRCVHRKKSPSHFFQLINVEKINETCILYQLWAELKGR